ncbi:MAG: pilus assembly protein PilO [Gammaproteobacteria bacterium]|nr:MAG: pilus assembly protein PilO [Gammaproteobacteria bacterium]
MDLSRINELDFENLATWPMPAKVILVTAMCAVLLGAGYWFKTRDQLTELEGLRAHEIELKETFEFKQEKAANLEAYKLQLEEMKQIYGAMLRQLPSKTEMPELLVDVSQSALASGLETELFQPGAEVLKDFFAEQPIALRMTGDYHSFGTFISTVAALPRIVILTLHDISLRPATGGDLIMEGTAKTYRYMEEDEESPGQSDAEAGTTGS